MSDTSLDATAPLPSEPINEEGRSRRHLRIMSALILREMSSIYGRNPGGYVWAILEPLGAIVIMALAFSLVLRTPSLGSSFILFYASGMLPFVLYIDVQRVTANAFRFSRPLLRYPVVSWVHAVFARFILYMLTGSVVTAIIMSGILANVGTNAPLRFEYLVVAMLAAGCLGLGVGLVNSLVFAVWPMWKTIWSIISRPLFLASGVLYIYEDLPTAAQDVLWYNPLIHVTTIFRQGIFTTYSPSFVSSEYVFGLAITLTAFGLLLLRRHYLRVMEAK